MTPEDREELRAQVVAQPDLAIDLLEDVQAKAAELGAAHAALTAQIQADALTRTAQADVLKALSVAAGALLKECVGPPVRSGGGDPYAVSKPSWRSLEALARALAPALAAAADGRAGPGVG